MTSFHKTFGRALLVLWAALHPTKKAVPMQFTSAAAAIEPQNIESTETKIPTLAELGEEVLDDRERRGVRGAARERSRFRTHILTSTLANMLVTDVTKQGVRGWLRWMEDRDAQVRTGEAPRKLDPQTIKRSQSLLSVILAEAVERDLMESNQSIGVKLKKVASEADTEDEIIYLTVDEQARLTTCEGVSIANRLLCRFAIGTGLRMGELSNLELADLHVEGSDPYLDVRYSNPLRGKKMPPKNGKKRRVPLLPYGLAAAKDWLDYMPTWLEGPNQFGLVFPTARGFRRPEGKICGRGGTMRPWLLAAGIHRPEVTFHALRHTFASNLVSGVWGRIWTPHEVQPLMGHSSVQVTEIYAKLHNDAVMRAARETVAAHAAKVTPAPDTEPMPDALETLRDLGVVADEGEESHAA